jgi:hypothetical protein
MPRAIHLRIAASQHREIKGEAMNRKKTIPISVHLDAREVAIIEAEAKALGKSRSAWIREAVQQQLAGGAPAAESQAAMLAADLSISVLAHLRIMLMPSAAQRSQIGDERQKLLAENFEPEARQADDDGISVISPDDL